MMQLPGRICEISPNCETTRFSLRSEPRHFAPLTLARTQPLRSRAAHQETARPAQRRTASHGWQLQPIVLVGNLTRDPEIRYVDGGGKAVTKFALAINRKTKSADETMYLDIVAWDRLGEICNQYLKKSMSTLVEGRLVVCKYDDKDGNERTAIEVVASNMQMLDSKNGAERSTANAPAWKRRRGSDPFPAVKN